MPDTHHRKKHMGNSFFLHLLYGASFLFSIHLALTAYVNSTFLSEYTNERFIGVIYALASIVGLALLSQTQHILKRFGNYRFILTLLILSASSLFSLGILHQETLLIPIFILYLSLNGLILVSFDVFVEKFSDHESLGKTRGTVLTVINLAWIFAPLLVGFLLKTKGYSAVYRICSGLVILVYILFFIKFKNFKDAPYTHLPLRLTLKKIIQNKNILKIFGANFLLQLFFSWMVIYMPLYLHHSLGYDWGSIGIIFTVMLMPFVLFELPLGRIADRFLGEKEILIIGFIISAVSTFIIAHMGKSTILLWALALFATRVGASMIEVMTESYFFKQINASEAEIISFFRGLVPIAYIIGPLLSTVILFYTHIPTLFIILSGIMLIGPCLIFKLKDTK